MYLQPFINVIESAIENIEELFGPEMKQHVAEVSVQWSILTNETRSRLLSTGNKWLSGLQTEELDALVRAVAGPKLENWRKRGLELRDWYYREDQQSGTIGLHYGEMETLRDFDEWFSEIINYLDTVIDLATKSAFAAQVLGSP
jgi:hypothetical protein